jgi:outer membrane protein assembly factor BamE (lipoprotein component of BamABCDE complex)
MTVSSTASLPFAAARRRAAPLALAAALGLAAGCTPVVSTHGYAPPEEMVSQVVEGVDTRGSVRRKLGRPGATGTFTEDGWYYVATTVSKKAFYAPRVVERRIIAIEFDDVDRVAAVRRYGLEDGRVVDLETRTTPTFGRELTILQQVLGNLGSAEGALGE